MTTPPDPKTLARRVLDQQVRDLRAFASTAHAATMEPLPGSTAAADLEAVRSDSSGRLLGLRAWAHQAAATNLHAAEEHFQGLRQVILSEELLPLPAMALGRSVYDALMQTCWLADVRVSTGQRICRWAGRLLHDTQETTAALAALGHSSAAAAESERTREARKQGQELLSKSGFVLQMGQGSRKDDTSSVSFREERSRLAPRLVDIADAVSPTDQTLLVLFSGAAHSRGWFVGSLEGDAATVLASATIPLLDATDDFVVEISAYLAQDPAPFLRRTHQRRIALNQAASPRRGRIGDAMHYRSQRGLPPL